MLDFGSSQSIWQDRLKYQGTIPGVRDTYLPDRLPLNTVQEQQFGKLYLLVLKQMYLNLLYPKWLLRLGMNIILLPWQPMLLVLER